MRKIYKNRKRDLKLKFALRARNETASPSMRNAKASSLTCDGNYDESNVAPLETSPNREKSVGSDNTVPPGLLTIRSKGINVSKQVENSTNAAAVGLNSMATENEYKLAIAKQYRLELKTINKAALLSLPAVILATFFVFSAIPDAIVIVTLSKRMPTAEEVSLYAFLNAVSYLCDGMIYVIRQKKLCQCCRKRGNMRILHV